MVAVDFPLRAIHTMTATSTVVLLVAVVLLVVLDFFQHNLIDWVDLKFAVVEEAGEEG